MTRKLPKAMGRTIDDIRRGAAEGRSAEERAADGVVAGRKIGRKAAQAAPPEDEAPPRRAEAESVRASAASDEQAATQPALQVSAQARAQAREVVESHTLYAGIGGLIPVPLLDIAGVTAMNVHMVKALARIYEVPFDRDRTRAVVAGLVGGLGPSGLGVMTATTLARLTPVAGLAACAVSGAAAAACTRTIGLLFIKHFEGGGTLLDFRLEPR